MANNGARHYWTYPIDEYQRLLTWGVREAATVRALRADMALDWTRQGHCLTVTLPTLSHHEALHIAW